jgi:glycosyltransferase involved in cell wall biosynthesis
MGENEELPFISVIIPAYNEEKRIANAIEALLRQTYPKDKMELIVVDDGSTDKTCEVVTKYPVKLIRHNKNRGDSASRNTGAKNALGEIIATTDADDSVNEKWLVNIAKHYSDVNVSSVVGSSHITYNKENWQERIIAELFICMRGSNAVENIYDTKGRVASNRSIGSNQSFRKNIFLGIRGYDMGLTAGMEQDIIWRVEKAGYKIAFEPNAKVYITLRDNFKKYIQHAYSRGKGGVIIYFKHPAKITFRYLFNMLYFPLITAMSILGVLFNMRLFMYLVMMVLVLPMGYYLIRIPKGWQHIKKTLDVIFILIIGYISFIVSSLGILRGCFDYIVNYEEKLMDKEG